MNLFNLLRKAGQCVLWQCSWDYVREQSEATFYGGLRSRELTSK